MVFKKHISQSIFRHRIPRLIFLILLLINISGCSKDSSNLSEREKMLEDANLLFETIETNHIMFAQNLEPLEYYILKEEFLNDINENMNREEFFIRSNAVLASLNDGHTYIIDPKKKELNIQWRYIDGKLIVLEKTTLPQGSEIISIGGTDISEIIEFTKTLHPIENQIAIELNIENYAKKYSALSVFGVEINLRGSTSTTLIEYKHNEEVFARYVRFFGGYEAYMLTNASAARNIPRNRSYIKDDVFIFQLGAFWFDHGFNNSINSLAKYIENGGDSVIIDLRDSPGGNIQVGLDILDELNATHGMYSLATYIPKTPLETDELSEKSVREIIFNNSQHIVGNIDVNLIVLTNRYSFSSAVMLPALIQDANIGIVVGEIPANSPNAYIDSIMFKLPYSEYEVFYSHKYWARPNEKAPANKLIPDYIINFNEDALEIALQIIKDK